MHQQGGCGCPPRASVWGRPAPALLHDRQLFEARRMLSETKIPVQDIAQALGFGSAAYFSRSFQARTGKTPTAFRRAG